MKKIKLIIVSVFILLNSLIIFSDNGSCKDFSNNIFYVGGNGEGNYSSIQEAINVSLEGDLIFVFTGIYNENIKINKSISLLGENKETTIINGNNNFNAIDINASGVNISRFTIKNALVSGIFIENVRYCNIFQNNINANNIGIKISIASNLKIFNNTISDNLDTGINISCDYSNFSSNNNTSFCFNNFIFHNNFINNTIHCYDQENASWSYNKQGNYYDDYTSLDKNNDGIGDKPYIITPGDSKDYYPLMMPYTGKIRIKEFYVDEGLLYKMLVISMVIAILFVLPIGYIWYRKYYR
jgi:hypothetical protein